jgi:predicted DNA-binding transcriptional regulator YafY
MAGRKKGRFQQTVRVLAMLRELRLHHAGLTLDELAERCEVGTRQVRRDLCVLEEAGHELHMESLPGEGTRVRLLDAPFKGVQLSLRERYALLAARRVFDVLEHTPLHEDVRSVFSKVARSMPVDGRAKLAELEDRFVYLPDGGRKLYAKKQSVLDALMSGVLYRARVSYEYVSLAGRRHGAVLAPYAMVLYKHGLYVVGVRDQESVPRVFAVERFKRATYQRSQHFEVPRGFRIDDFFEGAFGIFVNGERKSVTVEFTKQVAEAVLAREWHPTQRLEERADGKVRLHMEVTNLTQVLPWLLGWGEHVRVIQPRELAAQVQSSARAMLRPGLVSVRPERKSGTRSTAG